MTLDEARSGIGRLVVYSPHSSAGEELYEFGVITSVNDTYVFVRYDVDKHSKATRPETIEFPKEAS